MTFQATHTLLNYSLLGYNSVCEYICVYVCVYGCVCVCVCVRDYFSHIPILYIRIHPCEKASSHWKANVFDFLFFKLFNPTWWNFKSNRRGSGLSISQ